LANNNNAHGLRPLGISLGGGPAFIEQFSKAVGYGTAIFQNDAVNRVADGSIEASATPGSSLYSGVALNYGAALTATDHLVITSPDALFEAQDDGTTGQGVPGITAVGLGMNANLVLTAGVAATSHISKHQIAASTLDTTNTLDMHLLKLLSAPDNAYGQYARIEMVFNRHRMAPGVAGV
jgi:hypothetical protein